MPVLYRIGAPLGAVLGRCPVAVAGTRDPTPWGAHAAREVGRRLAEGGHTVVTGLARGVDEEAALGALEAGRRVVAVLPHLLEGGRLSPRASWLLRVAARRNAPASAVAENLGKDGRYVRTWLVARNRIVVNMAAALVVPEARFKLTHWGTRHAVERALSAGRSVIVLKPQAGDADVLKAFEYFMRHGAVAAEDVDEAFSMAESACRAPHMFKNS